jgi:hypothetical protein
VNVTDRALKEGTPSLEESKREGDDVNWGIEDAKKAESKPKEIEGPLE